MHHGTHLQVKVWRLPCSPADSGWLEEGVAIEPGYIGASGEHRGKVSPRRVRTLNIVHLSSVSPYHNFRKLGGRALVEIGSDDALIHLNALINVNV